MASGAKRNSSAPYHLELQENMMINSSIIKLRWIWSVDVHSFICIDAAFKAECSDRLVASSDQALQSSFEKLSRWSFHVHITKTTHFDRIRSHSQTIDAHIRTSAPLPLFCNSNFFVQEYKAWFLISLWVLWHQAIMGVAVNGSYEFLNFN